MNRPTTFTGYDCAIWLIRTSNTVRSILMGRLKDLSSIRYLGSIGDVLRPALTPYSISRTDRELHKALIETRQQPSDPRR